MKQKSLFSSIGLVVFLSVGMGCTETTSVQTQTVMESSQSTGAQPLDYNKGKVEEMIMMYFDSLNKGNLEEYNSAVKKPYQQQPEHWYSLQEDLVEIKDIAIDFNNATFSDGAIKVPVKFTQIMVDSFIPTNINPGVNIITRDFFLKIDDEGKYYIADFSSVY